MPGTLRIYLGAAPGVGKTFALLSEGVRRFDRGRQVVVADVNPRNRDALRELATHLPSFATCESGENRHLDLPAIRMAKPDVVLVDDLATYWRDVEVLLAEGVDVIATVDVYSIASLSDVMTGLLGERPEQAVPDAFLRRAEQVELVDMTPEALLRRIAHGNVFGPDDDASVVARWSSPALLADLRRHALLWLADGLRDSGGLAARESVVVALTGASGNDLLLRRAARLALRARSDLVGVHVVDEADDLVDRQGNARRSRERLVEGRHLLEDLGGTYHEASGASVAEALVTFARSVGASQLVLGASRRSRLSELTSGSIVREVIRLAGGLDVHVIGEPNVSGVARRSTVRPADRSFRPVHNLASVLFGTIGLSVVISVAAQASSLNLGVVLSSLLVVVVVVSMLGSRLTSLAFALIAPIVANWFLVEPRGSLHIGEAASIAELAAFAAVAILTSSVVSTAVHHANEARLLASDAEFVADIARSSLDGSAASLPSLLEAVRSRLGLERVEIVEDSAETVADAVISERLDESCRLVGVGRPLGVAERRILPALVAQVRVSNDALHHEVQNAETRTLRAADALKLSLLQTVSHDLRTPLAAIKASVTSLRDPDVAWSDEDERDFLETIEASADRLSAMVANTLDFARLQSGLLAPIRRLTSLEEVIPAAIASLGPPGDDVSIHIPIGLPDVMTDGPLLERVIANLVSNALQWSPQGTVRVISSKDRDVVRILVIDRGPGIPAAQRVRVMEPFERGAVSTSGIGLGLAIAGGLTQALGAQLHLRDTPGGGLTAEVALPRQPSEAQ